jgi:enoyl-[acyl-carrier protein] reductase I
VNIPAMLGIDLKGKRALVAGVADDGGFGFAIAKQLAEAGASICVGTWPPALGIFKTMLERGKFADSMVLESGGAMEFEKIYPLDAEYDTYDQMPEDVRTSRRYRDHGDVSVNGLVERLREDFGEPAVDIVVHSLANGPEVKKPLLETSRHGYLGAVSVSSYSFVSMIQRLGDLVRPGGSFLALSYMASEKVIPGYGGGMSSAKAALESDARTLSYEAGRRWGHRINVLSAGAYASRAASAIGFIDKMIDYTSRNAPIEGRLEGSEVGNTAAFLASPLASAITGTTVYVDRGYHAMGMAVDEGS